MESTSFLLHLTKDTKLDYPGLQLQPFDIYVNVNVLQPGHTIQPTKSVHHRNTLVIQTKPEPDGEGFKHSVICINDDPHSYFPPDLLKKDEVYSYGDFYLPPVPHWGRWLYNYIKY